MHSAPKVEEKSLTVNLDVELQFLHILPFKTLVTCQINRILESVDGLGPKSHVVIATTFTPTTCNLFFLEAAVADM